MSEYNRHKWAMEWMHGGGRDPNGRSLDDEIRIGKEDWMERQRVAQGGRIGFQDGKGVFVRTGSMAHKIREYFRGLKKGAVLDAVALEKNFSKDFFRILNEPEFVKKKFTMKGMEKGIPTAATLENLTPDEYKAIETLHSKKYNNLKGEKLIKALWKAGKGKGVLTYISRLRSGSISGKNIGMQGQLTDAIVDAYETYLKKHKKLPHASELYDPVFKKVGNILQTNKHMTIQYIGGVLRRRELPYEYGRELIHENPAAAKRAAYKLRQARIEKFSNKAIEKLTQGTKGLVIPKFKIGPWEFKGMEIGGVHKHHMNSLLQNVNLRNVAYISGSDNYRLGQTIEKSFGKIYADREKLLKAKPKGWRETFNAFNDRGRTLLDKLPERLKGLINFKVMEVDSTGKIKSSNIGMNVERSVGAGVDEKLGKIDFNKMNKSQQKKILALHAEQYEAFKANRFKNIKTGALGTLGGLGVAAGTVGMAAEYQEGKPWEDVFVNLPIEFASFGMIPATEISQQLRIRGDLKKEGLSLEERNEKMALYNRAKAQEAIEQDVGEVGLESYALSGLGEGETKEQAYSIKEDEDIELLKRKIERGYDEKTRTWPDRDPIAFEEAPYAEGGSVPRSGYKEGLGTLRGIKKGGSNLFKNIIKSPGARKFLKVAPWILGYADFIIEGAMALPALARGNPQMARRSTTPGVFGSYGGTMLEDIRKYNRGAYRYVKAMKDVNEWNALEEDIQRAKKVISGEIGGYPEVAQTDLAEAKKKQALLEKNFSETKEDDFQSFQDTMTQMAEDSREWSGDKNWLGQERGEQVTQESLEAEGVKPIAAHMMMQNADTTDEWRTKSSIRRVRHRNCRINDVYRIRCRDFFRSLWN